MRRARFRPGIAVGVAATVLAVLLASPAWADLRLETEITYRADVSQGDLSLESQITLTNLTADETEGVQVIRYFFDHIQLRVPETVQGFRATSGGIELEHSLEETGLEEDEGFLLATIGLGQRLFYEESMDMLLEYVIPGDPPRSETIFRINPAYISFGVAAWGSPGDVTVNVVAPASFDLRLEESDWDATEVVGTDKVFTVTALDDPTGFFIHVQGYDDTALASDPVDVPGFDVVVRSWPDDDEWRAVVTEAVGEGLPELQSLIGLEWIPSGTVEIRESADVTLAGYGGWYLQSSDLVEIGEWANPQLVLHELSHTWFNHNLFLERWIHEGLAEEYSTRAAHNAGLMGESVTRRRTAPSPSPLVGPLNDWVIPTELPEDLDRNDLDEYEGYGYRASLWVIQELVDEIGVDAMSAVLRAAAGDQIAYQGATEPESVTPPDDWRRFLDLVQELGGSSRAEPLFQTYVTGQDLTPRASARASYQELVAAGEGWHPPYYVRRAMSEWDFDTALERMESAGEVVETGGRISANYTTVGLEAPQSLRQAYERATDSITEAAGLADRQLEASRHVVSALEALERERNLVMEVGLIGSDLDADFGAARNALAAEDFDQASTAATELADLVERAERRGAQRLVGGGAVTLTVLLGGLVTLRRRRLPAGRGRHRYAQRSRHQVEIDAAPDEIWPGLRNVDLRDSTVVRFLLRARGFRMPDGPVDFESLGFTVLSEKPPRHLILGVIGQFWRGGGGRVAIEPEDFAEFSEPGYAKAVWVFQLTPVNGGRTRLVTETRVQCTDERSRRRFSRYWRMIAPFSGLIRRRILRSLRNSSLRSQW